jgi:hypothetical protein
MQPRSGATENVETISAASHIRVSENRRQKEVVNFNSYTIVQCTVQAFIHHLKRKADIYRSLLLA